ncbi:MAG: 50S ribosomal protein L18 [Candidatus Altiarchaeales archaeon]|nr:50S ribosomal protein L18 [Candidatus Altiarchaeales archaeon]MBD3415795.1 50S ribosomal protein L18 [Candidatus Altiarchaeales archaeon]
MATGATYSVRYRRKRQQKTDYKRRLNLLKSETTRFVVRPTNKNTIAQLIEYSEDGDKVVAQANSGELKKMGWAHSTSNTPAAYLSGLLCGVRGREKGVEKAVLDTGLYPMIRGSRIYAALKGLIDSGVESGADEVIFPAEDRIRGKVIAAYVERSKNIEADFDKVKASILKSSK